MGIKEKTISGVKWTTTSTIITALAELLKISVLARFLEAEDFGVMAIILFVINLMNLTLDMGLTSAILHKENIKPPQYSSLFWLNIIMSMSICLLLLLLNPTIANFYQEPKLTEYLGIISLSIIFSALGNQFKTIEQKKLNFSLISKVEIFSSVISLVVAIVFAIQAKGIYSLIYSLLAKHFIANLIYLFIGIKNKNLFFHFNFQETLPFLKIGLFQFSGQAINYFNRDFDILIIGKFFGSEILGGYSLAKQLVQRPSQVLNPIILRVASPVLSLFQKDITSLKNNFLKLQKITSTLSLSIHLLIIVFAVPIVKILYGSQFNEIVILVQFLSAYMYFRSVTSIVSVLIIATGKTQLEFLWNLFVLIIMPLVIYAGAQFSTTMVSMFLLSTIVFLIYPFWRFIINTLIPVSFKEYITNFIPNFSLIFELAKNNTSHETYK
jgi:O-antigen/teichoic acid export membrane protein